MAEIEYDEYVRKIKMFRIANRQVTSESIHLLVLAEVDEAAVRHVCRRSTMLPSTHMGRESGSARIAVEAFTDENRFSSSRSVGVGQARAPLPAAAPVGMMLRPWVSGGWHGGFVWILG